MRRLPMILVAGGSLMLSGCAALLLGVGLAGGYAVSQDSVRNVFDLPKNRIFDQSLAVAKQQGVVTVEDRVHGRIQAKIQKTNITITVRPLTRRAIELKVQGRNDVLLPEMDVVQDVYTKILEHL